VTTTPNVPLPATRVLLLDDHRVFTEALSVALDSCPGVTCVAVAHTVEQALALATEIEFDVAVVDLQLPDGGGPATIPLLLARRPDAAVIVLTAHSQADLSRRAAEAGARGFFGKEAALDEIVRGIRAAHRDPGHHIRPPAHDPAAHLRVTPREHEVLQALSRGLDAARIATSLGISLHTTRDHIRSVMGKLGVRTQLDAVVTADRLGLVTVGAGF